MALDACEDGGQLNPGAADAPADPAHLNPGAFLADQRDPRITLQGEGTVSHRAHKARRRPAAGAGLSTSHSRPTAQSASTQHVLHDDLPVGSCVKVLPVTFLTGFLLFQRDLHLLQAVGGCSGSGVEAEGSGRGTGRRHPPPCCRSLSTATSHTTQTQTCHSWI